MMFLFIILLIIGILGLVISTSIYLISTAEANPEKYNNITDKLPFKLKDIFGSTEVALKISIILLIVFLILIIIAIILIIIKRQKKGKKLKNNPLYKIRYNEGSCELYLKTLETDAFKEAWEEASNIIYNHGFDIIQDFEYEIDGNLKMVFTSSLGVKALNKLEKHPKKDHHITIINSIDNCKRIKNRLPYYGRKMYTDGSLKEVMDGEYYKNSKEYTNTYSYLFDDNEVSITKDDSLCMIKVEFYHLDPDGENPVFRTDDHFSNFYQLVHYGAGFNCVGYRYAATYLLKSGAILTEIGLSYENGTASSRSYYGDDADIKRVFETTNNFALCSYVTEKVAGHWLMLNDSFYLSLAIGSINGGNYLVISEDISQFEKDVEALIITNKQYKETPDEVTKLVARLNESSLEEIFNLEYHKKLAEELSDRMYLAESSIIAIESLFKDEVLVKIIHEYLVNIFDVKE